MKTATRPKAVWKINCYYKGVPIFERDPASGRKGGTWQSGASCWASMARALKYVDELEREGLLEVHQRP